MTGTEFGRAFLNPDILWPLTLPEAQFSGEGALWEPQVRPSPPLLSLRLLKRGQLGLPDHAAPLPRPSLSTLPTRPPPHTLTWVWPEKTAGSAGPSLPSSPPRCEQRCPRLGRGWWEGAAGQSRRASPAGLGGRRGRLGLGQCWGALSTSQDELFTGLLAPLGCLPVHTHAAGRSRR